MAAYEAVERSFLAEWQAGVHNKQREDTEKHLDNLEQQVEEEG